MFASVGSPATIASAFGSMEFVDGVLQPQTVTLNYEAPDLLVGLRCRSAVFPARSMLAMLTSLRSVDGTTNVITCTVPRNTSAPVVLSANAETTYGTTFLDVG